MRWSKTTTLPLEALAAGVADLDLLDPFGEENLVGREAACGIGIEDGIDDVPALPLGGEGGILISTTLPVAGSVHLPVGGPR